MGLIERCSITSSFDPINSIYLIGFPFADSWFSHLFYRREPCLYFNIYNVLDKLISRFCGIVSEQCHIFLSNPEQRQVGYRPFAYLWDYFINVKSLVYFNDSYLVISWILLGIMSFCLGWTLIVHIGEKRFFEVRGGFLLLAIILTVFTFGYRGLMVPLLRSTNGFICTSFLSCLAGSLCLNMSG